MMAIYLEVRDFFMKSILVRSQALERPDTMSGKLELYLDVLEPISFTVFYYDEQAIPAFHQLNKAQLAILPWGYHWEKSKNCYGLYKLSYANEHHFDLILYGPDENGHINYNFLVDKNNVYTLAHTRSQEQAHLSARDRKYPYPIMRNASGYKGNERLFMPGHCVDHVDSIIPSSELVMRWGEDCNSSYNPANYIPEVQKDYWGLHMRRALVGYQRKNALPYAQLAEYPDQPELTLSKAAVPSSVYFYCLDEHYAPNRVAWINWETDHRLHKKDKNTTMYQHMSRFSTPTDAAPHALVWDINYSSRDWRTEVRNKRILGHEIRKHPERHRNVQRDQLYAYSAASSIEISDSYSSISTALAASPLSKKLTKATLKKATQHGAKLLELDDKRLPVDQNRLQWVKTFHKQEKPGFEHDDLVDSVRKLSMK